MWSSKKLFFRWWVIAVLIYLIFSAVVTRQYGTNFLMPLNDDTVHHIQLAKNLINYRTFSLDGLNGKYETSPPKLTNFLTPGYALWLALIYIIFKSFIPAIFIGAIIFALSIPLTYLLAQEITGNSKIAFWSALVFMVEPLSIYHSSLMFTEQLFVPVFLAGVYLFFRYIKEGNVKFLFVSAILFSVSTLIRPILFYFLPVLVFIVFFKEFKISIKHALILGIISLVLAYSIIGIWLVRNKTVLNTWQISSNTGAILYGHHYEPLMRSLNLAPGNPNVDNLDVFSPEYNKILGNFAIGEILKHKAQYLKLRLTYVPLFFLSNGYDNIVSRLTGTPGFDKYFRWDLISVISKGSFAQAFKMILNIPKSIIAVLVGFLFWLFISILALMGFWRLFKRKAGIDKRIVGFIGILILYFDLITTPLITARYRLPINAFIFIFAVSGIYYLKDKIKQWI
jgi:4-amino-4-deoxy-L-arabinose transferase-like glycosyltransferase